MGKGEGEGGGVAQNVPTNVGLFVSIARAVVLYLHQTCIAIVTKRLYHAHKKWAEGGRHKKLLIS